MKSKVTILFFIIFIFTILSCCEHGHETEESGHAHDEILSLFAYGEDFELFAEATPFVTGQTGEILAHFSHLENFKPLAQGTVTVSLVVGEGTEVISQTLENQERTGIYLFSLKPQKAGSGKLIFDIKTSKGDFQVTVPNIMVYTDVHEAHEAAAQSAITSVDGISFTKEQSWKVDFATDEARLEPFGQMIRTTAQIQPLQGDERIVSARTSGLVLFSNEHIVEGRAVNTGQRLFYIDGSQTTDNNLSVRYAEAESEYARAKAEVVRKAELAEEGVISQSVLLAAQTDFANAEANYINLKQNFSAGRQGVSSPIGGFVTRIMVQNGEYVEAGQPVLVVSQNRDLLIKAEVQPKYYDLLSSIVSANLRVLSSNRTYTLEELGGRVLSYGKSTDLQNPLVPIVFLVNNKIELLVGSFVELFIKTQTTTRAVTVPNEALTEEMGNFFVFVQLTPVLFEKRWIKKGASDGIRTEIIEGIIAGERVVSKGAMLVKLSHSSGVLDPHAGHVH